MIVKAHAFSAYIAYNYVADNGGTTTLSKGITITEFPRALICVFNEM